MVNDQTIWKFLWPTNKQMASGWPKINTPHHLSRWWRLNVERSSSSSSVLILLFYFILFSTTWRDWRTVLRTAVGAAIVARQSQNVSDNGLLQFEEALIDFGTVTAIVVEGLHQGSFLAVDHHRNPGRHFFFLLRLKVVGSIVCDLCQMKKENKKCFKRKWTRFNCCLARLLSKNG